MEKYLFSKEVVRIDDEKLSTLCFDDFKTMANILNDDYSEYLADYYNQYELDGVKPFYNTSLSYNSITHEKKFRFIIVLLNDDEVFVPYKVIQIVKTKQIRFFGFPVSKSRSIVNVKRVFYELSKMDFTRFVFAYVDINKTKSVIPNNAERIVEYYDFYYSICGITKYKTSKYRSKNYINKLFNDDNISISCSSQPNVNSFCELREKWKNGMVERGHIVPSTSDDCFKKIIKSQNSDLRFICIYYKKSLISLQVFLCNEKFGYADCLYILHLWDNESIVPLMRILNNIVEIQKYLSWLFLYENNSGTIKRIYIAGCRPTEKRLLAHKEKMSDGVIEYFIV